MEKSTAPIYILLLIYKSNLPYWFESPEADISVPIYGLNTNVGSLVASLPDKVNKCKSSLLTVLFGLILNSTVLADEDKASVSEDDQLVLIKNY